MATSLSEEEKIALEELQKTSAELEKTLTGVSLTQQSMVSTIGSDYSFDRHGNRLYKNSEIKQNYAKATWGLKWYQLPYCKTCILSKLGFWALTAPFVGVTFAMFKQSRNPNQKMGFKNVMRFSLLAYGIGLAYTFVQNIFYNDYCNVNSYHYDPNASRSQLASRVKESFKKNA